MQLTKTKLSSPDPPSYTLQGTLHILKYGKYEQEVKTFMLFY